MVLFYKIWKKVQLNSNDKKQNGLKYSKIDKSSTLPRKRNIFKSGAEPNYVYQVLTELKQKNEWYTTNFVYKIGSRFQTEILLHFRNFKKCSIHPQTV